LVVLGIVFSGCKKEDQNNPDNPGTNQDGNGNKLESLSIDPAEITLIPGDTIRLSLLWTPSNLDEPTVEWSTSDTNVVKLVDAYGAITAVAPGEAEITATTGEIEAKAKITVVYYEDQFGLTGVIYSFPSTKKLLSDSIYIMTGGSGTEYKCRLYSVELFVPSTDFTVTSEGVANGEGDAVFATANVLYIEEGDYANQAWDFIIQITEDEEKLKSEPWAAEKGSFDPAIGGPIMQDYLSIENARFDGETFETAYRGAVVASASISDEGVGYSYIKDGLIESGYITSDYDQETDEWFPVYDFTMYWLYGWYGLAVVPEATTYAELLLQPYEIALSEEYHYVSEYTLQQAPRMRKPASMLKTATRVEKQIIPEKPVKLDIVRYRVK
jgi:hypothetical protein